MRKQEKTTLILSRYSYFFKTSKGVFLAYSSKTNSFLEISEDLFNILLPISNSRNKELTNEIPNKILDLLKTEGFVCNKGDDDDFVLKSQFITQSIQHDRTKLGLVIAPTLNCNFNCPYCFEPSKKSKAIDEATINNLIAFIKGHTKSETLKITWYGGEPLLALKSIKNILDRISNEVKIKLTEHSIITNGYLFEDKAIEVFKQYPLDSIQITIDGNKNRHNKLRALKSNKNTSTYDRIIKNIINISQKLPNTQLHIRVNIDKENKEDYFSIYKELNSLIKSNNVVVYPGILRLENEEKTMLVEPAFSRRETSEFIYDITTRGFLNDERIFPMRSCAKTCTATCVNSYIIGASGEIYKCWNDVSDPKKIVGNIKDEQISNSSLYYRYHQGCMWYNDKQCKECFFMPICNGKCAWYNERNLYHSGKYNLCQCLQKSPGLLNKSLEYYYEKNTINI